MTTTDFRIATREIIDRIDTLVMLAAEGAVVPTPFESITDINNALNLLDALKAVNSLVNEIEI